MITLNEVMGSIKKILGKDAYDITAIETGCSFMWEEEYLPYLSSLNIIKNFGCTLYSIDSDKDRLDLCRDKIKEHLDEEEKYMPISGDSVKALTLMKPLIEDYRRTDYMKVRLFFLDSSEDEKHGLEEYELALKILDRPGVICIDDYGCHNSVKWVASSDRLKKDADYYLTFNTPTGLIVGVYK